MVDPVHNIKTRFAIFNKWDEGLLASRSPHFSGALGYMQSRSLAVTEKSRHCRVKHGAAFNRHFAFSTLMFTPLDGGVRLLAFPRQ
jgi:hypothetical protein